MALLPLTGSPPELLFWIPPALAVEVGLSNRPEPLISGDFQLPKPSQQASFLVISHRFDL